MNFKEMSDAEKVDLISSLYTNMSRSMLAKELNVTEGYIKSILRRLGITKSTLGAKQKGNTLEDIEAMLVDKGSMYSIVGEYTRRSDKALFRCKTCSAERRTIVNVILASKTGKCTSCSRSSNAIATSSLPTPEGLSVLKHTPTLKDKATFKCNVCDHIWSARADTVYRSGYRCPSCANNKQRTTVESARAKANKLGLELLSSSLVNNKEQLLFRNLTCNHEFLYRLDCIKENTCRVCAEEGNTSATERFIASSIQALGFLVVTQHVMPSGKHLDIVIPSKGIAIEYNGDYWHSTGVGKKPNYHRDKTLEARSQGLRLIHVFESDYMKAPNVVWDMLLSRLGISETIHARKCSIEEISTQEARSFLEDNHLQGYTASKVKLGLRIYGELVMVMTLGVSRFTTHEYELIRMATLNNYTVVGGASKLFKYFTRNYNPESVLTYTHLHHSTGVVYDKLGFVETHITEPGYWYFCTKGNYTLSRYQCQKSKLVIKYPELAHLTEGDIMAEQKSYKVYDCGNRVLEWINPTK